MVRANANSIGNASVKPTKAPIPAACIRRSGEAPASIARSTCSPAPAPIPVARGAVRPKPRVAAIPNTEPTA